MKNILILSIMLTMTAGLYAQQLQKGVKAPGMNIKSVQGDMVSINESGNTKTLLAFFRYSGCPVCNFRVHEIMENYSSLEAQNIRVIAVFESEESTLKKYIQDADIPFPVIADADLELYKLYHVEKSFGKMLGTAFKKKPKKDMKKGKALYGDKKYKRDGSQTRIPADFLINEDGIIEIAWYGSYVGDHVPIADLLDNSK